MIQVEHLTKNFQGFRALNDTTLHVKKGSVYGLVGPNGAGKSTLIRHMTGIYRPDSGTVTIAGEPVYENAAVKQKIAYIPEELFYFMQADTMEMMHFYERMYPDFDSNLFRAMRDFFPAIDPKVNIRRLSKGMQKQVAFWLSICIKPEVMILDEPLDGLDPVMRRQVWSIINNERKKKELTILVSSHNLRELEDICDHVGFMHRGRMLMERSLEELQDNISKFQIVYREGMPVLPEKYEVLHLSNVGRVYTLIVRGAAEETRKMLESTNPILMDMLPLTLEEIFIYEMGGVDYEVKDIFF